MCLKKQFFAPLRCYITEINTYFNPSGLRRHIITTDIVVNTYLYAQYFIFQKNTEKKLLKSKKNTETHVQQRQPFIILYYDK